MIKRFKTTTGVVLICIYLLAVFYATIEGLGSKPQPMDSFALLIVTAPWSFLLLVLLEKVGIITEQNGDSFVFLIVFFGALINSLILYFLSYWITGLIRRIQK